ncbi:hypothetical protein QCA50_004455 [Cerrena zonata]|uniref:GPI mannosyltransferase 2 n=1 Tax=Cerrena zonata TaxID=2478898 RepID=A0AAW0GHP7_9APHY
MSTSTEKGPPNTSTTHVSSGTVANHLRLIRVLSVCTWLLSTLLLNLASYLPLFDSSPRVVLNGSDSPFLRWDVFHFGHIATEGYIYEYEWAFFPGLPFFVMRLGAFVLHSLGILQSSSAFTWDNILKSGALIVAVTGANTTLYELTLELTGSPQMAFLSSLLSLLPSSPATLRLVPYTEPFFTFLSYKGMLYCARSRWFPALACFWLAANFRSNGFMLNGFIIWGMLVEPILFHRKMRWRRALNTLLMVFIAFMPFIGHQTVAYIAFCRNSSPGYNPPWCSNKMPLIYTYVQSKYWNSGFLLYWTLSQLPNFLLCAPVLALLLWFSAYYILRVLLPYTLHFLFPHSLRIPNPPSALTSPLLTMKLAPHAIHAFLFTLLLLFASHTQIILRLAASMPFTYWAAAHLCLKYPVWGKRWVTWSVVWGAISIVLWATFLPPA